MRSLLVLLVLLGVPCAVGLVGHRHPSSLSSDATVVGGHQVWLLSATDGHAAVAPEPGARFEVRFVLALTVAAALLAITMLCSSLGADHAPLRAPLLLSRPLGRAPPPQRD